MKMNNISRVVTLSLCLLPFAAYADPSGVTLYGRINVSGERAKLDGVTDSQRTRLSSNSSNLGIRGTEKLGAGLNAWFQVEQDLRIDGDTAASWATRNSAVGLNGNFGTLLAGRWDTPYKTLVVRLDPFGDSGIPSMSNLLGQAAFKTGLTGDFQQRPINAVQYWTPNLAGFSARAHISTNEGTGNFRRNFSGSATYENGPFYAGLGYEKHVESIRLGSATNKGDDTGGRVALGYNIAATSTKLGAVYETLKYETTTNDLKRNGYWFSVDQGFGGNQAVWLTYGLARDFSGNNAQAVGNSGAKMLSLAYDYKFSKRTDAYVFYTKVDNELNAFYDFGNISYTGVAKGADLTGYGVGVIHRF